MKKLEYLKDVEYSNQYIPDIKLIERKDLRLGNSNINNMIIEGENLTAINYLKDEFKEKIDVIYIDPPYNTNVKKLSYKDDFIDLKFSNSHYSWISFMKQRLNIAYQLLSSNGVMYISIDDVEFAYLLLLCNDLFGEENIKTLIWPKVNPFFDQNRIEKPIVNIKSEHEYIITCFKNFKNTKLNHIKHPKLENNKWVEKECFLKTILDNLGTTSSAKDELAKIFGDRYKFLTPKPMKLIKELIRAASNKDSFVLDFFAGSGTTGHSVLDLNQEDGGKRKFILINNNENNICREITYERIKRVNKKNIGIKYFTQHSI